VPDAETSAVGIEATLQAAEAARTQLDSDLDKSAVIARLVHRAELRKEGMQITLDLGSFVTGEQCQLRDRLKVTRLVPLQIRRWGFEMRLVVGGGMAPSAKADPALLKAVARGFRWFDEIASGQSTSAADIARRENLDKHYVSRMIPLAFLAPSIIEAISKGTQPPKVTTEKLTRAAQAVAEDAPVTVTHFTNAQGAAGIIQGGGVLRPESYVTTPSEVAGLNASQVESRLEIDPGKGALSSTFQTPSSNLATPSNGAFTSGGAVQFQPINPTTAGPFVPTPP